MALLINNAKFKNTEIEAPQIYVRLQFVAFADGKTSSVQLLTGLNKQEALAWQSVSTNLPEQIFVNMKESESQDLATIHNAVKAKLEAEGFEVTIDLA